MLSSRSPKTDHCTHPSMREERDRTGVGAIRLPVLPADAAKSGIRKSKSGKRRAIVLAIVQGLILVHIAIWLLSRHFGWFDGLTITPVEPSESMEFVKHGVINAGLIFFGLALLSTLILGRWFCGWGCHVVMLQDLCGWFMRKLGVRPKPFRSRFLIYVPLLLALYMFVWPAAYRWVIAPLSDSLAAHTDFVPSLGPVPDWPGFSTEFTTQEFWKTFPGWMIAIPFLVICGFATVYFLGSKGFCTYGCPYGGFFAPLDKLAPARIIVNDNCHQCGHCTAVCTSNVRVHDEVREYGMVVDPGCMKCLDCVSVCPNEALSFGFAKPALLKGAAKSAKPKRVYDLSLGEEFGMAIVFALAFFSFRGDIFRFPLLMTAGVAGVMTFLVWKLWRLLRDPSVNLYRFQFKLKGAMRVSGWIFAILAAVLALGTLNAGAVNGAYAIAQHHAAKINIPPEVTFGPNPPPLAEQLEPSADRALRWFRIASFAGVGGIGLIPARQTGIDFAMAKVHCAKLEFADAELLLRRALDREQSHDGLTAGLMWVLEAQGRRTEAIELGAAELRRRRGVGETLDTFFQLSLRSGELAQAESVLRDSIAAHGITDDAAVRLMTLLRQQGKVTDALQLAREALLEHRDLLNTLGAFVQLAGSVHETQLIVDVCLKRLKEFPEHLETLQWLSIVYLHAGNLSESLRLTERTLVLKPHNPGALRHKAIVLAEMDRMNEAIKTLEQALHLAPDDLSINALLGDMLEHVGRREAAAKYRQKVEQLRERAPHQHTVPHAH